MVINDRECKEIKLKNGDKVYLVDKIRGKEYRKIRKNQFNNEVSLGGSAEDLKVQLANMTDFLAHFPIVCKRIVRGEKEIPVNMKYVDDLEGDDIHTVENAITNLLNQDEKKA